MGGLAGAPTCTINFSFASIVHSTTHCQNWCGRCLPGPEAEAKSCTTQTVQKNAIAIASSRISPSPLCTCAQQTVLVPHGESNTA